MTATLVKHVAQAAVVEPIFSLGQQMRPVPVLARQKFQLLRGTGTRAVPQSLPLATQELERLQRVRQPGLTADDLQYVMTIHGALEAHLVDELHGCCSMITTAGYQDIRSLQTVAFLKTLLDIYCEALAHPLPEWQAGSEDGAASFMAVRTAKAAGMLAMFCWVRSEAAFPIVWQALAAAYEFSSRSADGAEHTRYEEALSAQLFRTLLLLLADPYSMKPMELVAADYLIADSLHDMALGSSWANGSVAFDLALGLPLANWKAEINPRNRVVWLPVSQAATNMLANEGASMRFACPDLPRVLAQRWGSFPAHRHSPRMDAFIGSPFICGAMSLVQAAKASTQPGYDKPIKQGVRAGILLDYSDTGCRIRLHRTSYLNLAPGVLVGFELPSMRGLSAGVVRWVKHSSERHTEAGIRFVAREFEPVPLRLADGRWEGGNLVEFGLLAVGAFGSLDKTSVEIILPRNKVPAKGVKALKAVNTGGDFHVQEVLEVGHDFLRIAARTQASQSWSTMELAPFSI